MASASAIVSVPASTPHVRPQRVADRAARTPEEALWWAILNRVLTDSLGIDLFAGTAQRKLNKSRARSWLETPSRDRDAVLLACDVDPGWFDDRIDELRAVWAGIDAGEIDARRLTSSQRQVHSLAGSRFHSLKMGKFPRQN